MVSDIHQDLFARLPEEDRTLDEGAVLQPGELRDREVSVGVHAAPASAAIGRMLERWASFYLGVRRGELQITAGHVGVRGIVVAQGTLDVQRQGVLPLDLVAVVRVHRTQQRAQPGQRPRLGEAAQAMRLALQVMRALQQRPEAVLAGQQWLHLGRVVVEREFLRL
ncbi:hypothetical protein H8R02_04855 [Ramlibacter sp. GTP1]|uniref:Uncharacterized protein n=1 Tax=Ramlibacter albus TaxID=2079448 RepID=A0A923M6F4_9BURK|nr:hypothetical protein [Ramlibacter albus]MBC5763768.1 hypothetical protein [Ramlibacter albus]